MRAPEGEGCGGYGVSHPAPVELLFGESLAWAYLVALREGREKRPTRCERGLSEMRQQWLTDYVLAGHSTWKSRIRACVIGRDSIYGGSDIVIIARTDAMAIEGYDAALERVNIIHQRTA